MATMVLPQIRTAGTIVLCAHAVGRWVARPRGPMVCEETPGHPGWVLHTQLPKEDAHRQPQERRGAVAPPRAPLPSAGCAQTRSPRHGLAIHKPGGRGARHPPAPHRLGPLSTLETAAPASAPDTLACLGANWNPGGPGKRGEVDTEETDSRGAELSRGQLQAHTGWLRTLSPTPPGTGVHVNHGPLLSARPGRQASSTAEVGPGSQKPRAQGRTGQDFHERQGPL